MNETIEKELAKCGVCMDEFSTDKEVCLLTCCSTLSKDTAQFVDKECLDGWIASQQDSYDGPSCLHCRAPFKDDENPRFTLLLQAQPLVDALEQFNTSVVIRRAGPGYTEVESQLMNGKHYLNGLLHALKDDFNFSFDKPDQSGTSFMMAFYLRYSPKHPLFETVHTFLMQFGLSLPLQALSHPDFTTSIKTSVSEYYLIKALDTTDLALPYEQRQILATIAPFIPKRLPENIKRALLTVCHPSEKSYYHRERAYKLLQTLKPEDNLLGYVFMTRIQFALGNPQKAFGICKATLQTLCSNPNDNVNQACKTFAYNALIEHHLTDNGPVLLYEARQLWEEGEKVPALEKAIASVCTVTNPNVKQGMRFIKALGVKDLPDELYRQLIQMAVTVLERGHYRGSLREILDAANLTPLFQKPNSDYQAGAFLASYFKHTKNDLTPEFAAALCANERTIQLQEKRPKQFFKALPFDKINPVVRQLYTEEKNADYDRGFDVDMSY